MNYILQKDFNWFGNVIPAGTIYIQYSHDEYVPVIDDAHVPYMKLNFMNVKSNEAYFKPQPNDVILSNIVWGPSCGGHSYVHSFTTRQPISPHLVDVINDLIQQVINK